MIDDDARMDEINKLSKGECPNEYWKRRYRIKKDHVPTFLQQYQQKILRTGKYLNTIKQCSMYFTEQNSLPLFRKRCYSNLVL